MFSPYEGIAVKRFAPQSEEAISEDIKSQEMKHAFEMP
jgi:hypothetical protein